MKQVWVDVAIIHSSEESEAPTHDRATIPLQLQRAYSNRDVSSGVRYDQAIVSLMYCVSLPKYSGSHICARQAHVSPA